MRLSSESHPEQNNARSTSRSIDWVIGIYGWGVLAAHAVIVLHFLDSNVLMILTKDVEPLCWPYFRTCGQIRFETVAPITILIITYILLIIGAAYALAGRYSRTFWILVLILNLFLFAIISLDYRLRGNQPYMLFWLSMVFLFWPAKRWAVPLILVSFYFWAGTLKLNYEWLSGAVLYRDLYIIPMRFAWVACAYVVILEMVAIWGLLSKRAWLRWLTLGQLALFHAESISQVGWFYPLLMATLLTWFVIEWLALGTPDDVSLVNLLYGRAPRSVYVLLGIFAICQLAPYFYHGDKELTGQGRIFALDMLEARQVCDVHAVIRYREQASEAVDLLMPQLPARKICDPIIYYDRMTNLCLSHATDPDFEDADFVMHARRTTDATLKTIVDEANFCSRHETYNIFSSNSWMK
jgi:hypothetical protein